MYAMFPHYLVTFILHYLLSVGYTDEKIQLVWMDPVEPPPNSTETDYPSDPPVVVNPSVELPQFEVVDWRGVRCNKVYHQRAGTDIDLVGPWKVVVYY